MKPRPDALAKLLEHCDGLRDSVALAECSPAEKRKTRRLVNALLRERAEQVMDARDEAMRMANCEASCPCRQAVPKAMGMARAAVLRRPTGRARGRA